MADATPPSSGPAGPAGAPGASLRLGQAATVLLLFGGYASLYFCRADLSVATPLLVAQMEQRGIPHADALVSIGSITSLGVGAYALGKLFLGGLGDFWGGRPSFLIGLAGATLFTALFAAGAASGGLPLMAVAWVGSFLTQSLAWAGLIKVSSRWFDYTAHGTVIGILSMSYLVGDAAARHWMGLLIAHGVSWQGLFYFAAAVSGTLFVANGLFLRESRTRAGHSPARPNPLNVYGDSQGQGLAQLLLPLLRSRAFLLVCVLSFACTIVRETFNVWTPDYLREHLGYDPAGAASASAVFPAVGAVSVLLTGWVSDWLGERGRTLLIGWGLAAATGALLLVRALPAGAGGGSLLALLAIGAVAFCLLGPYSCLAGSLALDFGGARGGAIASGLIDGVGYLGGVLAGDSVARIAVHFGWQGVFLALAGTSALAAAAAVWLHAVRAPARAARPLRTAAGAAR